MRIFADFHHAGMAQGVQRLFHDRLGHDVYFPSRALCETICAQYPQQDGGRVWTFQSENPDTWHGCEHPPNLCPSMGAGLETPWELILCTRTESLPILQELLRSHYALHGRETPILAINGNGGGWYEPGQVFGLLTSDLATWRQSPPSPPCMFYAQEIGAHFFRQYFVPIRRENLKTIQCFMNFLSAYDEPYGGPAIREPSGANECPHCRGSLHDSPEMVRSVTPCLDLTGWQLWEGVRRILEPEGYTFKSYGKGCEQGNVKNADLPRVYTEGALTWHFKHVEGYGFSLLQSLPCGRLPIVQERFYRYRTAGRYLIPELTCLETPWEPEAIAAAIRWYTSDLDVANEYAYACYQAARGVFNWFHEAQRVEAFLERTLTKRGGVT